MRLGATAFVLTALSQGAVAAGLRIFLHDPSSQPSSPNQPGELEPVPARLVLAQRAGIEEYHKSDILRQDVVDAINAYGSSAPLFIQETTQSKKALLMMEGLEDFEASLPSLLSHYGYKVSSAPSGAATRDLFVDLAKQMDLAGLSRLDEAAVLSTVSNSKHFTPDGDLIYRAASAKELEDTFAQLVKQNRWSITALVTSSEELGETDLSVWGTYEMPSKQGILKKRATAAEAPQIRASKSSSSASSPTASSTIVRGILPACFATLEKCEKATQNCSGHGKCKKKYSDKTAAKTYRDCFSCSCTTTKSKNGKTTTSWGGPACQKKDISTEFWLIVLFTVGLIFVIGFAVGQIWEMGNQELPSVIGAGVSGPSARK